MAFALTSFQARSLDIQSTSKKRGVQQIVMGITGTTADVALDISNSAGTFWTAAQANATFGTLATKALAILVALQSQVTALKDIKSEKLIARVRVATLSAAGQYTVTITSHLPSIAFNAADGETAISLLLEFEMVDGQFPVIASYA